MSRFLTIILIVFVMIVMVPYYATMAVTAFTVTINPAGGPTYDYTTLQAAENDWDIDFISADSAITYEISGGSWSDQSSTTMDGALTDATRDILIITTGSARHSGVWDGTNAYRIAVNGSVGLGLEDNFITVDGIQGSQVGAYNTIAGGGSDLVVMNCITKGNGQAGSALRGVSLYASGAANKEIRNCISYDFGTDGLFMRGTGTRTMYNNTIVDCNNGINGTYGTLTAKNTLFWSNGTDIASSSVITGDYNASDGTVSYGDFWSGNGANDIASLADPFATLASDDFHLASGNTTIAEKGVSLSGTFTDDIDGDSRPQSTLWDIGADELVAAATGTGQIIIIGGAPLKIKQYASVYTREKRKLGIIL